MGSYKKKLFIVLLGILLIEFFACGSVNATQTYYQTEDAYKEKSSDLLKYEQDCLARIFINNIQGANNKTQVDNLLKNYNVYFYYSGNDRYIRAYFYKDDIKYNSIADNTLDTENALFKDPFVLVPGSYIILSSEMFYDGDVKSILLNTATSANTITDWTGVFYVNTFLLFYHSPIVENYNSGILPSSSAFAMILQAINDNTEETEDVANQVKELNNFMKSEDVDQDAYNYPTNNPTQDPTTDGINNIFNLFYNRITSWDSSSINVYIPFANKSFTIPANASEQLLAKFSNMGLGSTLKSLISAVWFYVLARYIIKDVQKYADGLKTGEILTKSDTNIKTEML